MPKVYLEKYEASCALGNTMNSIVEKLTAFESGISNQDFNFGEKICLPIAQIDYSSLPFSKEEEHLFEELSIHYIKQLIKNTAISFQNEDTLLIISTTKGNINTLPHQKDKASLHYSINYIQKSLNTKHTPVLISNACISGVLAFNYAHDLIKTNQYKNVVVCATDLLSKFVVSGFNTFQAISSLACMPYDKDRSGVTLGEACAVALLSTNKSDIEVLGGASSNDANHISGPSRDGSGLALAIKKALNFSKNKAKDIDFINAHGTATLYNDLMESKAFEQLDLNKKPLNSLKGFFGHTLGAAGLLEIIISAEMMKQKTAFGTINLNEVQEEIKLNVLKTNRKLNMKLLLKTASGFGGCNAATILKYG